MNIHCGSCNTEIPLGGTICPICLENELPVVNPASVSSLSSIQSGGQAIQSYSDAKERVDQVYEHWKWRWASKAASASKQLPAPIMLTWKNEMYSGQLPGRGVTEFEADMRYDLTQFEALYNSLLQLDDVSVKIGRNKSKNCVSMCITAYAPGMLKNDKNIKNILEARQAFAEEFANVDLNAPEIDDFVPSHVARFGVTPLNRARRPSDEMAFNPNYNWANIDRDNQRYIETLKVEREATENDHDN